MGKKYGDERRGAKTLPLDSGDIVILKRQIKENKLQSTLEPTEFVVVKRDGAEVTVESKETEKRYRRNAKFQQVH